MASWLDVPKETEANQQLDGSKLEFVIGEITRACESAEDSVDRMADFLACETAEASSESEISAPIYELNSPMAGVLAQPLASCPAAALPAGVSSSTSATTTPVLQAISAPLDEQEPLGEQHAFSKKRKRNLGAEEEVRLWMAKSMRGGLGTIDESHNATTSGGLGLAASGHPASSRLPSTSLSDPNTMMPSKAADLDGREAYPSQMMSDGQLGTMMPASRPAACASHSTPLECGGLPASCGGLHHAAGIAELRESIMQQVDSLLHMSNQTELQALKHSLNQQLLARQMRASISQQARPYSCLSASC